MPSSGGTIIAPCAPWSSPSKGFLDADDDGGRGRRRIVSALTLELYPTHSLRNIDRLISKAIGAWGVEDLAVVVQWTLSKRGTYVATSCPTVVSAASLACEA